MTGREALYIIANPQLDWDKKRYDKALKFIRGALENLEAYKEHGTPDGFERAIQISLENYNLYREYKAKFQEYEAIGTVEEFESLMDSKKQSFLPYCKPGERLWYISDSGNVMEVDVIAVSYECKVDAWNHPTTKAYVTVENKYLARYKVDFSDVENRIFRTKEEAEKHAPLLKETLEIANEERE